jgi:hypothetical protein
MVNFYATTQDLRASGIRLPIMEILFAEADLLQKSDEVVEQALLDDLALIVPDAAHQPRDLRQAGRW